MKWIKYLTKFINCFDKKKDLDIKKVGEIFELLKDVVIVIQNKITDLYNLFKNDNDGIYDINDKSDQKTDIFQM